MHKMLLINPFAFPCSFFRNPNRGINLDETSTLSVPLGLSDHVTGGPPKGGETVSEGVVEWVPYDLNKQQYVVLGEGGEFDQIKNTKM